MSEQPVAMWGAGELYEQYVGRWSSLVAREFLAWLEIPSGKSWVDVGCGTGRLTAAILAGYDPQEVRGIDQSAGFLAFARQTITDPRVRFEAGNAQALPLDAGMGDVAVSGLVLNFVTDHAAMVREMARVTKPGGRVALYVWDYIEGMEMMRHFWDVAATVDPQNADLSEGSRFPICQPQPLHDLFQSVGLTNVSTRGIEIPTVFQDFADYWTPFLGKQGAAPSYLATLDEDMQEQIRQLLHARLSPQTDGTIALSARAWAVQGEV